MEGLRSRVLRNRNETPRYFVARDMGVALQENIDILRRFDPAERVASGISARLAQGREPMATRNCCRNFRAQRARPVDRHESSRIVRRKHRQDARFISVCSHLHHALRQTIGVSARQSTQRSFDVSPCHQTPDGSLTAAFSPFGAVLPLQGDFGAVRWHSHATLVLLPPACLRSATLIYGEIKTRRTPNEITQPGKTTYEAVATAATTSRFTREHGHLRLRTVQSSNTTEVRGTSEFIAMQASTMPTVELQH